MQNLIDYNPILDTDSYKPSQWLQYPPGTEYIYSYIESRGGDFEYSVFFNLQRWLKKYLSVRITKEMVEEAKWFLKAHGEPFNYEGWMYIVEELDGKIPVEIKAVPEGTVMPVRNVMATIVNTDPKCWWVTSYFETSMLRAIWYGTTVATQSKVCKNKILRGLEISGDPSLIDFKLHDFGARGVSSFESAGIGGISHLVNFLGTDTMSGILEGMRWWDGGMSGFSIIASEHSTMSAWKRVGEVSAYRNMFNVAKDAPMFACVIDTWDTLNAATNIWGNDLKQEVIDSEKVVVLRPDSGIPREIVVQLLCRLDAEFGSVVNDKGYKVLNNVRVIQGDGITVDSIDGIIVDVLNAGYSLDNVGFGMGGGLLQMVNRDTMQFAMKCSAAYINGEWIDVYKDPVTDSGKRSKRGRLKLVQDGKSFKTVRIEEEGEDVLRTVWKNGTLMIDQTFAMVRQRSNEGLGAGSGGWTDKGL